MGDRKQNHRDTIVTRDLGDMATTADHIAGQVSEIADMLGDADVYGEKVPAAALRLLYQQKGDLDRLITEVDRLLAEDRVEYSAIGRLSSRVVEGDADALDYVGARR